MRRPGALAGASMGETTQRIFITDDFAMSTMAIGLIGIAVFTVGLVWVRD